MPTSAPGRRRRAHLPALGALAALLQAAACGGVPASPATPGDDGAPLRLGYLPNLTNATPLVGVTSGAYARALGPDHPLTTATFGAGPDAVTALLSNSIDAAYLGPNPAATAFVQTHGRAVRVLAGAASGGAALVVRPSITSPADLRGRVLATPGLGNTQDVALRAWLAGKNLRPSGQGPGDVTVSPMTNAAALQAFRQGQLDGAWVPEPWATRFQAEAGARVLVDEASLWPNGEFATTLLVVRADYLAAHRQAVLRLLAAHVKVTEQLAQDPAAAQAANQALAAITGKGLPDSQLGPAWSHLTFTYQPLSASVNVQALHAAQAGVLARPDVKGIYDLGPLNQVLAEAGRPTVRAP